MSGWPDDIADAIAARWGARPAIDLLWHDTVTSTMDEAATCADRGARDGLVVGADRQTAGRGRRGHRWESPRGAGLYFSRVCRLPLGPALLPLVTLATGVAVRDALAQVAGLDCVLKWPNDVLVDDRKVAGILAEAFALGTSDQVVIIGIGVNLVVAAYPPEVSRRATSIGDATGRPVDRGTVFVAILDALSLRLVELAQNRDAILDSWRRSAWAIDGALVTWEESGRLRHGTTAGIDQTGALLVRGDGELQRVVGGEVRWHAWEHPQ